MRIRSTKPEFWRSRRVASVSWDARLVLKGLESYVDDNGVGKDDIALIVGDVFSRDMLASPRETVARVSEAISALHRAGLLWRYEADGEPLLYISWWDSMQRIDKPGNGRLRRPDGTLAYKESEIRESVASPRESVAPGTGEQGNRGTGEALPRATVATRDETGGAAPTGAGRFDEFWAVYPNRKGKADALKAWRTGRCAQKADDVIAGAIRYRDDPNREAQYTKLPAGWLRDGRWDDDPLPAKTAGKAKQQVEQVATDDFFERAMRRAQDQEAAAQLALTGGSHQ